MKKGTKRRHRKRSEQRRRGRERREREEGRENLVYAKLVLRPVTKNAVNRPGATEHLLVASKAAKKSKKRAKGNISSKSKNATSKNPKKQTAGKR